MHGQRPLAKTLAPGQSGADDLCAWARVEADQAVPLVGLAQKNPINDNQIGSTPLNALQVPPQKGGVIPRSQKNAARW
jgi:hypothetical protein